MPFSYRLQNGLLDGARYVPSPHKSARTQKVDAIVIHAISLPPDDFGETADIEAFFLGELDSTSHPYFEAIKDLKVSAHFVIDRQGAITQFVNTDEKAWHAGASSYLGRDNYNEFSIGIELIGAVDAPFEEAQYNALSSLICAIHIAYPATRRHLFGHSDIAQGRKEDPGVFFKWQKLRRQIHRKMHTDA